MISKNAFFELHKKGIFINQYLRASNPRAAGQSASGRTRAMAGNSGPVTLPRMVHGATFTSARLRMRLNFAESLRVMKYNLPSASANQRGVATAAPLRRNELSEMYR